MLVNEKDAIARLNSPLNLANRLRNGPRSKAMQLFTGNRDTKKIETKLEIGDEKKVAIEVKPFISPFPQTSLEIPQFSLPVSPTNPPKQEIQKETPISLDAILDDSEAKIKLGLAHDKALDLLSRSVDMLSQKLDNVKADKLPAVIAAAGKTVDAIRRERTEAAKANKDREVHYHFYVPEQNKIEDYEIVDSIDITPKEVTA